MPNPITFHVQHNLDDEKAAWEIHIYPIDPDNARTPAPWQATITPNGLTMQTHGITDHLTWPAILAASTEHSRRMHPVPQPLTTIGLAALHQFKGEQP